jgi:hypothetical protein
MSLEWLSTSRVLGSNLHSIAAFIYHNFTVTVILTDVLEGRNPELFRKD